MKPMVPNANERAGNAMGRPPLDRRPTISELEDILNSPDQQVEILPNGEVTARNPSAIVDAIDQAYCDGHAAGFAEALEMALAEIFRVRDKHNRTLEWCNALNAAQAAIRCLATGEKEG